MAHVLAREAKNSSEERADNDHQDHQALAVKQAGEQIVDVGFAKKREHGDSSRKEQFGSRDKTILPSVIRRAERNLGKILEKAVFPRFRALSPSFPRLPAR
jgi:hypothetical protein